MVLAWLGGGAATLAILGGLAHVVIILYRGVGVLKETVDGVADLTQQFLKHVQEHVDGADYVTREDHNRLIDRVDRLYDLVSHLTLRGREIPSQRIEGAPHGTES